MDQAIDIISVGEFLHVKVSGKLTKEVYEAFAPVVDGQIQEHGKVRILFEMHDFHGWTAGALWEDLKFDFNHWKDIERLAIVGETPNIAARIEAAANPNSVYKGSENREAMCRCGNAIHNLNLQTCGIAADW